MLSFYLDEIFKARQINKPYSVLVKAGISPHSAEKIVNNQTRVLRLDHIEKLCEILYCEPNDLLVYTPGNLAPLPPGHPLNKLISNGEELQWQEKIRTLPLSQLKELSRQITSAEEK